MELASISRRPAMGQIKTQGSNLGDRGGEGLCQYQHNCSSWSHEGIQKSSLQGKPAAGEEDKLSVPSPMPTRQPVCQEEVYEQGDYKRNKETCTIFGGGLDPQESPCSQLTSTYKWKHNPGQGIGHTFLEALGLPSALM